MSVNAATTYNIGPGQTYTTFTTLSAAHTLQSDDIVDGGGNTFNETWTLNGSGTNNHPIVIRNAIIDGQNTRTTGISIISRDYITITNLTIQNNNTDNILMNFANHIVIDSSRISAKGDIRTNTASFITISNFISTSASGIALWFNTSNNITVSTTTITNPVGRGIYSVSTTDISFNDVEVTGSGIFGIEVNNSSSGTISMVNVYSGITRNGASGGNVAPGIYINGCNGAIFNGNGVYSSYNTSVTAHGIFFNVSALASGSILKNFLFKNNGQRGIYIFNSSNLTIQSGSANYNTSVGIEISGASSTNIITEYVNANHNGVDGMDSNTNVVGWIVRYSEASYNGSFGHGIDNGAGDGFSIHDGCTATYYYVKAFNNLNTGFAQVLTSSGSIYNSIIANNGSPTDSTMNRAGVYLTTTANPGWTFKNNIVYGNYPADFLETSTSPHNSLDFNLYYPLNNNHFYTNDNVTYTSWADYHASHELHSSNSNPLFTNSANDFTLQSNSPAIDSGTNVGLTTDYIGNPIYGTPDMGVYEYQPPHNLTLATPDTINVGSGGRIYADGKFRDLLTTNGTNAHLKISPQGGTFTVYDSTTLRPAWLDVTNISNWSNTHKTWSESNAQTSNMITDHIVGDLNNNKEYLVSVNGIETTNILGINGTSCNIVSGNTICMSDGSGKISFEYTGGYSTLASFDLLQDTIPPSPLVITKIGSITNIPNKDVLNYYYIGTKVVLSGTGEAKATGYFTFQNNTYTATVNDSGVFIIDLPITLIDGTNKIDYYEKDLSGLSSTTRSLTLITNCELNFPTRLQAIYCPNTIVTTTESTSSTSSASSSTVSDNTSSSTTSSVDTIVPKIEMITIRFLGVNQTPLVSATVVINNNTYITDSNGEIKIPKVKGEYSAKITTSSGEMFGTFTIGGTEKSVTVVMKPKATEVITEQPSILPYVLIGIGVISILATSIFLIRRKQAQLF